MLLSNILPPSSFVKFVARKVKNPKIIWQNSELSLNESLLESAFLLPSDNDASDTFCLDTKKTYLGERYGGQGIGWNGGGVRCGLDGPIQIKGIGKNVLAGRYTDERHSYGGASLDEGIVEAVWGEIITIALPFGGARIFGLILTGMEVPAYRPKANEPLTTPRALIIRQPVLRPAHFMRATFFEPLFKSNRSADTIRTKGAIESLADCFQSLFPYEVAEKNDYFNACILEVFRRLARQFAAARAKRIMHGSLTASNLGLDGRWLDFSTASWVSDYGHIFISRSPDFMNEELALRQTVFDFIFYLKKYLPYKLAAGLVDGEMVWLSFNAHLQDWLATEFLKLTGVPEEAVTIVNVSISNSLYRAMQRVINFRNKGIYSIWSTNYNYKATFPERTGEHQLNQLLRSVAFCISIDDLYGRAKYFIVDETILADFVKSYWDFRCAYLWSAGSSHVHQRTWLFLALNSYRVNLDFSELYRYNLYSSIKKLLRDGDDVVKFINLILAKSITIFGSPKFGVIDLSSLSSGRLFYSVNKGFFNEIQNFSYAEAFDKIPNEIISIDEKNNILRYFSQSK